MQQNPGKPAQFDFNYPVIKVDTSQWVLVSDSVRLFNFSIKTDSLSPRRCTLVHAWVPEKTYSLEVMPGGATDFWGQSNRDTLRRILNVMGEKQLGSLNLSIEKLRPGIAYLVQLLQGSKVLETREFVAESDQKKFAFTQLEVASYTARLIEDRNGNGIWDTGDYWKQWQPEVLVSKKLEALRANWEVEASISLAPETEIKKKKN